MDYVTLSRNTLELIREFDRMMRQKRNALRGSMFILGYLYMCGSPKTPAQISAVMEVSSARVAAALGTLEEKGLISRAAHGVDRRRTLVSLTQQGEALFLTRRAEIERDCQYILENLGDHDAGELNRLLGRVVQVMQKKEESKKEREHA